jgi:hypothetical protein
MMGAALCAGVVILYSAWRQLRPAIFELADIPSDPDLTQSVPTRNEWLRAIEHTQSRDLRRSIYRTRLQGFNQHR